MHDARIVSLKPLVTFVRIVLSAAIVLTLLSFAGCQPLERQAYQVVVSSHAFLKYMKAQHPECESGVTAGKAAELCTYLSQATAAKDALIDAVEIYCAGPDFDAGGKCNPPTKGTPAATQAEAKLRAAISGYSRIEADLKLAAKGKP